MQKCPVCGREVTPAQIAVGSCPSCGAPISANVVSSPEPVVAQPIAEPTPTAAPEPIAAQPVMPPPPMQPPLSAADQPIVEPAPSPAPEPAQFVTPLPAPVPEAAQPVMPPPPMQPPLPVNPAQSGITQEMPTSPAPVYANAPTTPQYTPPAPFVQAPPKQNSGLMVGIIVAVVIIVLGGLIALYALGKNGSGPLASLGPTATATFTPTPTITPTPTLPPAPTVPAPASGFKTFTAGDSSYGLNYPQAWTTTSQTISQTNTNLEVFTSSDGSTIFGVFPFGSVAPANSQMQFLQGFLQGVKAGNVQIDANTQTKTVGLNTWTTLGFTFSDSGTNLQGTLYSLDHGSQTYFLFAYAPVASYAQIDSQSIQPTLTSFTFLK